MVKRNKHLANSFEMQIWLVISGLAALRGIVGIVKDLTTGPIHWEEFALDITGTALVAFFCYRIFAGLVSRISIWISMVLIALACINYLQLGGIGNGVDLNLMGVGVLLILANKADSLKIVMILFFSISILIIVESQYLGWLSGVFFIKYQNNQFDFIATLIAMSLIIYYFKLTLLKESIELMEVQSKLTEKQDLTNKQNRKLMEQKKMIDLANERLQNEFFNQTDYLIKNNQSIEKFVEHVTVSMINPLERIMKYSDSIKSDEPLTQMTKKSIHDLNNVVGKLKSQLKNS